MPGKAVALRAAAFAEDMSFPRRRRCKFIHGAEGASCCQFVLSYGRSDGKDENTRVALNQIQLQWNDSNAILK